MASVIQPTMRASKRHKQREGEGEGEGERETTTQNEMSNKEYENMRGR